MENFWDSSVWGTYLVIGILMLSLLAGNVLRKKIPGLQESLIPTSVLGGALLLIISSIYKVITGTNMFDASIFGGNGTATLEVLTYHCLAMGFIASSFKTSKNKLTKKRTVEIFNTGVTTVATYLIQAVLGFSITIVAAMVLDGFFSAAGVLLPFGFGQGTGQALNYGGIYENEFGFAGGKSFGLTIAAMGFLSAAIGGVFHLNIRKKRGKLNIAAEKNRVLRHEDIESENEIPMQESMDKMTVQIALIAVAYLLTYILMYLLGLALPGMKSIIYGFNFLLGVLSATLIKLFLKWLRSSGIGHKEYVNDFLMTRTSNFFFDLMVVAGVAAIRLDTLQQYWGIILILGVSGAVATYLYLRFVSRKLFPDYVEEQFLMMYGMLTGTASTGTILLREIDGDFKTPAADNMVYQNFPAIVFGLPLMLLATLAPERPYLTLGLMILFLIVMNVILFRSFIFKRKK